MLPNIKSKIVFTGILITAVLLILVTQFGSIRNNLALRKIDRAWNNVTLKELVTSNNLQDGIPDNWQARSWGGGQGVIQLLDDPAAHSGSRVISIQKTNREGVTALSQILPIIENTQQISFRIFAKGQPGAIQIRFFLEGQGLGQPEQGGWQSIPASDDWQPYRIESAIPTGADRVEVLLRSNSQTYFDDAFLWFIMPDTQTNNGAINADFEIDGSDQDPIEWWQQHAVLPAFEPLSEGNFSEKLPYLNIIDMLNGRYDSISQRIAENERGCLSTPEMTSWLLYLAPDIKEQGGPAAEEKLYQLAIRLAPTCSQPYGQLGALYEENRAFWAATLQYRKAAELAGNTPLAGFYYYKEGLTHVRNTGSLEEAIYALENAERLQTWVNGVVFQGAAAYNLGLALRETGRLDEASAAFQRVIDCDSCLNYQKPAQAALRSLNTE